MQSPLSARRAGRRPPADPGIPPEILLSRYRPPQPGARHDVPPAGDGGRPAGRVTVGV
ncbi:hypothetical protein SCOCK_110071 [Actinacidiphila cocklensis]|uniref:Uncharacterized protein n=1 Tax=Actinacidiphila cocklensis TaxID=887465 RepID=A0A9W4GNE0_9ACTN|nr:hypothetical protein SCOCK_110071 [Actinacidiphila cocklensis]